MGSPPSSSWRYLCELGVARPSAFPPWALEEAHISGRFQMLPRTMQLWRAACRPELVAGDRAPVLIHYRGKKSKAKGKASKSQYLSQDTPSGLDLSRYEQNMQKAIDALHSNYARLRVEGATPGLLDDVSVDAYGARTSLKNIAQVSVRDGRTLLVSVYDEKTSKAVEKAIRGAGLNLNPIADGNGKLRIPVPKPSNETRAAMREVAAKDAEAAKVATRMVRRKAMDEVKRLKEELSKDDIKRMENSVQVLTDRYIESISEAQQNKLSSIEGGRGS